MDASASVWETTLKLTILHRCEGFATAHMDAAGSSSIAAGHGKEPTLSSQALTCLSDCRQKLTRQKLRQKPSLQLPAHPYRGNCSSMCCTILRRLRCYKRGIQRLCSLTWKQALCHAPVKSPALWSVFWVQHPCCVIMRKLLCSPRPSPL